MSRTSNSARNAFYSSASSIISMILMFWVRTVFIKTIGDAYLGLNGLLLNLLGVLSFTDLGFGVALNYSLYKPVANDDRQQIKIILNTFKKIYHIIAFIVIALGIAMIPFLPVFIKDNAGIQNIGIYFLIYLFNTASSYFITYKYSLVNALQRNYLITNIELIGKIIISILQVLVLTRYNSFLGYLLIQAVVLLLQKIITNLYINKEYPYLKEKTNEIIKEEEAVTLKSNVKSLVVHKFAEISVTQTDNILITSFLSLSLAGKVSNYTMIFNTISNLLSVIFQSVISSLGNLIVKEDKNKQLRVFEAYHFIGFWLYGVTTVCFAVLTQPFIEVWIGAQYYIDSATLFLLIANYYLLGERIVINNFKTAAGIFKQDRIVAVIQAVVNLVASVIFVIIWGLPGIFLGTLLQALIAVMIKPNIIFRIMFEVSVVRYYRNYVIYALCTACVSIALLFIRNYFWSSFTIWTLLLFAAAVFMFANLIFLVFFFKTKQFQYILNKALSLIKNK